MTTKLCFRLLLEPYFYAFSPPCYQIRIDTALAHVYVYTDTRYACAFVALCIGTIQMRVSLHIISITHLPTI